LEVTLSSSIYKKIVDSKFKTFLKRFCEDSEQLFFSNEKKQLIHAGEFGRYREDLCLDFFGEFVPQYLKFSTGFIISSEDDVSTQCDLIAYDKELTPLINDAEKNYFFPIECVHAIGEVKSTIRSKAELESVLVKLSQQKLLTKSISRESSGIGEDYHFDLDMNDVFTFLICKKLDFNISKLNDDLSNIYESNDVPPRYKHNLIISLEDGLFAYQDSDGCFFSYPMQVGELLNEANRMGFENIKKMLAQLMFAPLTHKQRICVDIGSYLI
jgi:hypothetical protein